MSIKGFNINGSVQRYDYDALDNKPTIDSGLSEQAKRALLACFEQVAWIGADGKSYYDALEAALYPQGYVSVTNTLVGCKTTNEATSAAVGKPYNATIIADSGYTLTGANVRITMGGTSVTGYYSNGTISIPNVTGDIVIRVTAASAISSITAVFTQGDNVIYTTDSLDTLRQYLVVTANFSDSTTATVTDYTLSGTLTEGTSTITVSYGGKTTTFTVTVTGWDFEWEYSQGTPIGNGFAHSTTVVGTMLSNGYQIKGASSGGCNIITDPSTDSSKGVTEIIISYSAIPSSSYRDGAVRLDVNKLFAVIASNGKLYYSKNGEWGANFEEFAELSLNTDYKFRLEWDDSSGARLWMNDVLAYEITTALTASRTRWFLTATAPSATAVVKAMRVKVVE